MSVNEGASNTAADVQAAIDATATPPGATDGAQNADATQPPAAQAAELDPEERERLAIEAERKAQEGTAAPANTEAAAPAAPTGQQPPAAKPTPPNPEGGLRAALAAERKARQQAELAAANLQGRVAVLEQLAPASQQGQSQGNNTEQQAPQAPADPIEAKEQEILALAEQFDRGEITMADFKAKETAAQREIRAIEESRRQQAAVRSDTSLEEFNTQLMQQYPINVQLNTAQIETLTDMAYAEAALEGKPIVPGVEGTKDLRTRMARIAHAKFGSPTQTPAQPTPGTAQPSRQMAANAAALDAATKAPPDVSRMGSATTGALPSDAEVLAQMERMTDDEADAYLNSMPGVRARIRGMRAAA